MDLANFFKRIKFFEFIGAFIGLLILAGVLLAVLSHSKVIPALLIFLCAIFINYLTTLGLYIIYMRERYNPGFLPLLDLIITFSIAVLFGYKFISLFKFNVLALLAYCILWAVYLKCRIKAFKDAARYR